MLIGRVVNTISAKSQVSYWDSISKLLWAHYGAHERVLQRDQLHLIDLIEMELSPTCDYFPLPSTLKRSEWVQLKQSPSPLSIQEEVSEPRPADAR